MSRALIGESRARYAEVLDSLINDREEIVITRANHEPVVLMSLADFNSLRETAYLMRSPANVRRLLDAMERLEADKPRPAADPEVGHLNRQIQNVRLEAAVNVLDSRRTCLLICRRAVPTSHESESR